MKVLYYCLGCETIIRLKNNFILLKRLLVLDLIILPQKVHHRDQVFPELVLL